MATLMVETGHTIIHVGHVQNVAAWERKTIAFQTTVFRQIIAEQSLTHSHTLNQSLSMN